LAGISQRIKDEVIGLLSNFALLTGSALQIIDKTRKDIDFVTAAHNIDNESYWKEACELKWKLTRLEQHGMS